MARTSIKVKNLRIKAAFMDALAHGKAPKFPTRVYNRCPLCGRNGGYMRKFDMCRICFREKATSGKIMGLKKSSW